MKDVCITWVFSADKNKRRKLSVFFKICNYIFSQLSIFTVADLMIFINFRTFDPIRVFACPPQAAGKGRLETVKLLLEKGADVDAIGRLGRTPLHMAQHSFEVVRVLLEAGADVDAIDKTCAADHSARSFLQNLLFLVSN